MSEVKIAVRYAKALLEKANEGNITSDVNEDMKSFAELCKSSPEFNTFLKSPIVTTADKSAAIHKICSKFNPTTLSFFDLVSTKNRMDILDTIVQEFISINNDQNGIVSAVVTTSVELDKDYEKQIVDYIIKHSNAKEVQLEKVVDENIIGGIVIRFDDYLLDNSISTQINNLKKELNIA